MTLRFFLTLLIVATAFAANGCATTPPPRASTPPSPPPADPAYPAWTKAASWLVMPFTGANGSVDF